MMFKKFIILFTLIILLSGCGSNVDKSNIDNESQKEKNETLVIKTKVTNKEEKGGYLIYFMRLNERNDEAGFANQSAFGPFETDENGECVLDLKFNFDKDVGSYIKAGTDDDKNKLEMFIVTKEDIYIRNPLNKKTVVEFVLNEEGDGYSEPLYYSKAKEIEVSFTDKYPDNVLSLTFQDAEFVIKLEFDKEPPKNSFEVSIFWNDPTKPGGLSIFRVGAVSRAFQYWDTPFNNLINYAGKTGTIVIKDFETDASVDYEGNPKTVSFDKDGNPIGDKILKIKIKQ